MPLVLIGLFLVLPMAEILIFIKVGGLIGVLPTLAVTLACAVAGALLVRQQGVETLLRIQRSLQRGIFPMREMTDGAMLLIAGLLLLTPGLLTDAIGLVLLLPFVRSALVLFCMNRLPTSDPFEGGEIGVIEAEYIDVSPHRRS